MLNCTLKTSLHVIVLVAKALMLSVLITWVFDLPIRPAY
jgi:hypothetical protein